MKAKLSPSNVFNGKNHGGHKELLTAWSVVVSTSSGLREPVVARTYGSRSRDGASPVYGSVWIHGGESHYAGHGRANGSGYHKASAAIEAALSSAGVELSEDIDGRGDSAVEEALKACARALGYRGRLLVVRH